MVLAMNGTFESLLRNIEDFVNIEDKIVTYKWISTALKVHTNTAKQLLHEFTQTHGDSLLVTYLIGGESKGEHKYTIVNSKCLDKVKSALDKVTVEHVYSVQKGGSLDGSDLYNAESSYKIKNEDRKFCSIQGDDIARREIKTVPVAAVHQTKPDTGKTVKSLSRQESKHEETGKAVKNSIQHESKNEKPILTDVGNKNEIKSGKVTPVAKPTKKTDKTSSKGSINALFQRQAESNAVKKKVISPPKSGPVKTEPAPKEKEKPSKSKRKKKDESDSSNKRRKRIVIESDSESSDEEMEIEEEIEPEPEPEPPVTTIESDEEIIQATPLAKGRKRVRKQVDKTFEGEDGFILTEKQFVYESCSDDEPQAQPEPQKKIVEKVESPPPKSKPPSKKSTKTSSPSKNKQPSIMSFLKKK